MFFGSILRRRIVAFFAVPLLTLALGLYLGLGLSEQLKIEFSPTSRLVKKATRGFGAVFQQARPTQSTLSTNRLDLTLTEHFLPLEFKDSGGGIATDGGDGLLILDKDGRVFHFHEERLEKLQVAAPQSNKEDLMRALKSGELGEIDIRFGHFRFNDILVHGTGANRSLLTSFTEWHATDRCITSTLAKAPIGLRSISDIRIARTDWAVVARTSPCLGLLKSGFGVRGAEAGGRMIADSGSKVLWTSGAYNRDDHFDTDHPQTALAQNDASDYGKVLRVDIKTGAVDHIAKGLRNPQGIDRDAYGDVMVTDHGMRGGDELNVVHEGANFGFPLVTLGTKYSTAPGGAKGVHGGHDGFAKPVVAFVPSIAPSSVLALRDFHPNWDGDVLVGGLRRQLHRVYREDGAVLFVEPIDVGARVRDMTRMQDGRIAILSDDNKIVLVEPGPESVRLAAFQSLLSLETDPDLRTASRDVFEGSCLQCHGIEADDTGARPSLFQVCGRAPGSDSASGYSGVLPRDIKVWDQDTLVQFISAPDATVPGTTMAWNGVGRHDVAQVIARTLCQLDPVP